MATVEHMASAARKFYDRYQQTGNREDLVKAKQLLETVREIQAQNPETFRAGLLRTFENIPGSGAQFLEDIVAPIVSPVQTAKGLKDLAVGLYEKMTPGLQPEETNVDALVDFFKQRYGGWDETLRTLREDPVGFLGDVSTVLGVGGATIPGRAGTGLTRAAAATDPLNIAGRTTAGATRLAAQALPESVPEGMYQSAAKFGTTLGEQQRQRMAQTALQEQLMPTSRGLEQAYGRIRILDDTVDALVEDATTRGVLIPRDALFTALKEARQEMGGARLYGRRNLAAIDRVAKNFHEHLKETGQEFLTPQEVLAFKQDIHANTNYARRNLRTTPASEAAEKAFATAARRSTEAVTPQIADLNARLGRILELAGSPRDPGPLARSAARIENRDILGIGLPLKMMAGEDVLPGPGGVMGTIQGIMDMPRVKSRLALDLYRMKHPEIYTDPFINASRSRVGEFASSPVLHGIMFQSGRYGEDIAP